MADLFLCVNPECAKRVTSTKNGRYRTHWRPDGEKCELSSTEIPPRELDAGPVDPKADPGVPEEGRDFAICGKCGRKVKLTALGYLENHDATLRGGDRCPNAGIRYTNLLKKTELVSLPGDAPVATTVLEAVTPKVSNQAEIERTRVVTAAPAPATEGTSAPPTGVANPDRLMLTAGPDVTVDSHGDPEEPAPEGQALTRLLEQELGAAVGWTVLQPGPWVDPAEDPEAAREPTDREWSESLESTDTSLTLIWPGATSDPSGRISQPGSPVSQPEEVTASARPEMTPRAKEIAARVKEIFYAYQNRKTTDNRSAQTTLGPSEIGTPCDRRLAMSLMGIDPVNPGGDGWAAFVGTWGHEGMRAVFEWADGGTGRFATELALTFPSEEVPRGTTDLLDRVLFLLTDWKFMGEYSLKKFIKEGPSEGYRIQGQVYGLGATLQGEKVKEVAIIALPRAGRSLEEMWVHVEKFDKKVALAALARVKKIREQAFSKGQGPYTKLEVAGDFSVATKYECTYCPFHLKGDKEMLKGCPGA